MPIKIADSLPARAVLESENIFVMTEHRAATQDIRPLRIGLLNLMPLKIITETQILFIQHADPDRGRSDPDRNVSFQKYAGGSSSHLLQDIRRYLRPEV